MNRTGQDVRDLMAQIEAEQIMINPFDFIPIELWDDHVWIIRLAAGLRGDAYQLQMAARRLVSAERLNTMVDRMVRAYRGGDPRVNRFQARRRAHRALLERSMRDLAAHREELISYIESLAYTFSVGIQRAILRTLESGRFTLNPYSR